MTKLTIHFDGGCNPNPGEMYGSYSIQINGFEAHKESRLPLGRGTNNEAEFKTLIAAIQKTCVFVEQSRMDKSDITVDIVTDSKIVMNRVSGRRRNTPGMLRRYEEQYGKKAVESAQRMQALAEQCIKPLILFHAYEIRWAPREHNVNRFGH